MIGFKWECGKVLEEISQALGDKSFCFSLWNGITSRDDKTPTVEVWKREVGCFDSRAETICEGLLEVVAEIYTVRGKHQKHRCSFCNKLHGDYDLTWVPVESLEEVMREAVEIAAAMTGKEVRMGRLAGLGGPTVNLIMENGRVKLYIPWVQERFYKEDSGILWFRSEGDYPAQLLEDVLNQARDHLNKYGPHTCPVCGKEH